MKSYMVFKDVGEVFNPIKKYATDDLESARTMAKLLAQEDPDDKYFIMQLTC